MDKKTFMAELGKALSVLQEEELKDIIGEYEQHIDMKVQSGLTEEEAIADFGSLAELSAEILEAYHVRADYAASNDKKEKKSLFGEGEKAGKEFLQQTGEICVKTGENTVKGLRRLGIWLSGVLDFWRRQCIRPFAWAGQKWTAYRTGVQANRKRDDDMTGNLCPSGSWTEEAEESLCRNTRDAGAFHRSEGAKRPGRGKSTLKAIGAFLAGCMAGTIHACITLCCWCVRTAWNVCWAGFAGFCGLMGLFCLFGLGMLVVLLPQGYPLAGVTIGCLGLNLCLFAAAGFALTLIVKKKEQKKDQKEEETYA